MPELNTVYLYRLIMSNNQLFNNGAAASHSRPSAFDLSSLSSALNSGNNGQLGEVQHVAYLSEHIGSLYLNDSYSDIVLVVNGAQFQAHKVILAARSEYFRALLFGGMRESNQREIELQENNVPVFKILLRYIYTGRLTLSSMNEEFVLDMLGLAHKYGFIELESTISDYLKAILTVANLCTIYGASQLYSLSSLSRYCLDFADRHASELLTTKGFLHLNSAAVQQLISRDSFCAPEIEIFRAVREWARLNPDTDPDTVLCQIRLPLMNLDDLLNVIRPTGLLSSDVILDAIKEQTEKRGMDLHYRGLLVPDTNVATTALGAVTVEGELKQALLNGDTLTYDMERGFSRHPIEERSEGIVVQLGASYIINHIRLLLWDRDQRAYSYYVEVSMDRHDWVRVVDYTTYLCRSWQRLYFPAKVVKFIRVCGTHNTVNRVFHLVALEASYSSAPWPMENGLIVPRENVATLDMSASVIEGVSRLRHALINGDSEHYDWDSGYTCHQLGSGAIVVQFPQPYAVDSMRLLLWDCDDRSYSYYVEVSLDQINWTLVADKSKDACKSWQTLRFDRQPVTFVRIIGTHNTANEVFHCVHFECPAASASSAVSRQPQLQQHQPLPQRLPANLCRQPLHPIPPAAQQVAVAAAAAADQPDVADESENEDGHPEN